MWTSEANNAYLGPGLICHYLTATFEMVSLCLAVEHPSGRHTGANIVACLKQILSNYSVKQALVSVADNASNMDLAVLHLAEWNSRHCFGHTLQLTIVDGIKTSPGMPLQTKHMAKSVAKQGPN